MNSTPPVTSNRSSLSDNNILTKAAIVAVSMIFAFASSPLLAQSAKFIVLNNTSNDYSVIDESTNAIQVVSSGLGTTPTAVAAGNGRLVMTNQGSDSVSIVRASDFSVLESSLSVGVTPTHVAFGGGIFAVVNNNSGGQSTVSLIDGATNTLLGVAITVGLDARLHTEMVGFWLLTQVQTPSLSLSHGKALLMMLMRL